MITRYPICFLEVITNSKLYKVCFGLTEKTGCDIAIILPSVCFVDPTPKQFFQYFASIDPFILLYLDRLEALQAAIEHKDGNVISAALNDPFWGLRQLAITAANPADPKIRKLAEADPNTLVRAAAISAIGKLKQAGYSAEIDQ